MNAETGFLHSLRGRSVREDPRGARHWGGSSCHRLVFGRTVRSWPWCRHAHRRRSSGRRAHSISRHQVPGSNTASRHLGSSIRQSRWKPVRTPNGA